MKNTKKNISIEKLHAFENHPYKVQDNEEMDALAESIKAHGVVSPIIVRPLENTTDEYEIISGHRRVMASRKAGITEVPALIYALDRDSAAIAVVDSNLHREHILPSEKAFAYKMKLDAMSRQGFRSDLTSDQVGRKLETADIIAQQSDDSKTQVRRYIRLTNLIPELLEFMDEGKMALSVGVELSYLDDQLQYDVLEQCEQNDCTPSYSQAFRMHKADREGLLTKAVIQNIMCEEKANQKETIKVSAERLRAVLPKGMDSQKTEDFIIRACEHYRKYLRNRDRDSR